MGIVKLLKKIFSKEFLLPTDNEKFVEVRANQWQKESVWNFEDLHCEIIGIDSDCYPKLKIIDKRHPFFNVGGKYNFTINNFTFSICFFILQ